MRLNLRWYVRLMVLGAMDYLLRSEGVIRNPELMALVTYLREVVDDGFYTSPPPY